MSDSFDDIFEGRSKFFDERTLIQCIGDKEVEIKAKKASGFAENIISASYIAKKFRVTFEDAICFNGYVLKEYGTGKMDVIEDIIDELYPTNGYPVRVPRKSASISVFQSVRRRTL